MGGNRREEEQWAHINIMKSIVASNEPPFCGRSVWEVSAGAPVLRDVSVEALAGLFVLHYKCTVFVKIHHPGIPPFTMYALWCSRGAFKVCPPGCNVG